VLLASNCTVRQVGEAEQLEKLIAGTPNSSPLSSGLQVALVSLAACQVPTATSPRVGGAWLLVVVVGAESYVVVGPVP